MTPATHWYCQKRNWGEKNRNRENQVQGRPNSTHTENSHVDPGSDRSPARVPKVLVPSPSSVSGGTALVSVTPISAPAPALPVPASRAAVAALPMAVFLVPFWTSVRRDGMNGKNVQAQPTLRAGDYARTQGAPAPREGI